MQSQAGHPQPTHADSFFADRTGSLVVSGPSPLLGERSTAQYAVDDRHAATHFALLPHGLSPVHDGQQAPRPTSVRLWIKGTTNLVSVQLAAQLQEPERQRACNFYDTAA